MQILLHCGENVVVGSHRRPNFCRISLRCGNPNHSSSTAWNPTFWCKFAIFYSGTRRGLKSRIECIPRCIHSERGRSLWLRIVAISWQDVHITIVGIVYTTEPLHVSSVLPNVGLTNARCVTPAVAEVEGGLAAE